MRNYVDLEWPVGQTQLWPGFENAVSWEHSLAQFLPPCVLAVTAFTFWWQSGCVLAKEPVLCHLRSLKSSLPALFTEQWWISDVHKTTWKYLKTNCLPVSVCAGCGWVNSMSGNCTHIVRIKKIHIFTLEVWCLQRSSVPCTWWAGAVGGCSRERPLLSRKLAYWESLST